MCLWRSRAAAGTMNSLCALSAMALASQPEQALQGLDGVAHSLYPLLFKVSYLMEQSELVATLLERWPLPELRLNALLRPSPEQPQDLRDRTCRACLQACVQGLARHVSGRGPGRLRVADLTGLRDVQVQRCPCGQSLGRWGRTELLARTCCALQERTPLDSHPIRVRTDLFITEGNFRVVMRALSLRDAAPLHLQCVSLRVDSLAPTQLLQVLCLLGSAELRRLEVVHNVRLHAGHVQQLLAQGWPHLTALTLPANAFDPPPPGTPVPQGEDPLLCSIAQEFGRMSQLTELNVAFSTLTGKIQMLLSPLQTPLRVLDLANCSLSHADMAFLASCAHAIHLEVLDLSGHSLLHMFPASFSRLLGRAAPSLRVLTLEECDLEDSHVGMLVTALGPCQQLQELRFLGNPLSACALGHLFSALAELPKLRRVEFPVPRDCYAEGAAYPQDELAASKFDQERYAAITQDLRAVLLQAGREDIQVSTPIGGSFDPDIQETSHELGTFLLQALKAAMEKFSSALKQME